MDWMMYLYVEVRRLGEWNQAPGIAYVGVNPAVLARLTGVTDFCGIRPLAEPRELPLDEDGRVSRDVWRLRYPGIDDETNVVRRGDLMLTSFLTLEELEREDWRKFSWRWLENEFAMGVMAKLRRLSEYNPEGVRVVFWVDRRQAAHRAQQPPACSFAYQ